MKSYCYRSRERRKNKQQFSETYEWVWKERKWSHESGLTAGASSALSSVGSCSCDGSGCSAWYLAFSSASSEAYSCERLSTTSRSRPSTTMRPKLDRDSFSSTFDMSHGRKPCSTSGKPNNYSLAPHNCYIPHASETLRKSRLCTSLDWVVEVAVVGERAEHWRHQVGEVALSEGARCDLLWRFALLPQDVALLLHSSVLHGDRTSSTESTRTAISCKQPSLLGCVALAPRDAVVRRFPRCAAPRTPAVARAGWPAPPPPSPPAATARLFCRWEPRAQASLRCWSRRAATAKNKQKITPEINISHS